VLYLGIRVRLILGPCGARRSAIEAENLSLLRQLVTPPLPLPRFRFRARSCGGPLGSYGLGTPLFVD